MKQASFHHRPVLLEEVSSVLAPVLGPNRVAVDCTFGGGGHAELLLSTGADVVGVDRDQKALAAGRTRFAGQTRLHLAHGDFRDVASLVRQAGFGQVHALLADLGVSSPQLDEVSRGFSFRQGGPLDMRMDRSRGATLRERLESVDESELARVLRDLGEERRARSIARAVLRALREGRLGDTADLAATVSAAVGGAHGRTRRPIHPATRTFQALRIWVNDELGALDALLAAIPDLLAPGGRVAIISFHSLEDRRVKQAFAALTRGCTCPKDMPVCVCGGEARFFPVGKRSITPTEEEARENPRARSARLRAIERSSRPLEARNDDEEVSDG